MDRIIELKSVYISMMGISLGVPYSLDNLLSKSVSSRQINFLKRNGYRYYLAADQSIRCMIDDALRNILNNQEHRQISHVIISSVTLPNSKSFSRLASHLVANPELSKSHVICNTVYGCANLISSLILAGQIISNSPKTEVLCLNIDLSSRLDPRVVGDCVHSDAAVAFLVSAHADNSLFQVLATGSTYCLNRNHRFRQHKECISSLLSTFSIHKEKMNQVSVITPNYPKPFVNALIHSAGLKCEVELPTRGAYGHCYANDPFLNLISSDKNPLALVLAVSDFSFHTSIIRALRTRSC